MDEITPADFEDAAYFDGADMFIYMAQDELHAIADADTPERIEALNDRIIDRRARLDEFSRRRIERLAWDHDGIQALFDRAGIDL